MAEKPIRIRGHQLPLYQGLSQSSPEQMAEAFKDSSYLLAFYEMLSQSDNRYWQDYIPDMIGLTPQQQKQTLRGIQRTFEEFLESSPQRTTHIVEGRLGDICTNAAVGNHCPRLFHDKTNALDLDRRNVNVFLRTARSLELPHSISTEDVVYPDDLTKKRRRVRTAITTFEATRKILDDPRSKFIKAIN
jgi:hypothetical protein